MSEETDNESLEFIKEIRMDDIKKLFILTKIYLESLCFWPYSRSSLTKFCSWFHFFTMLIKEIFHVAYLFGEMNELSNAVEASTTMTTNLEGLVRMHILLTKKDIITGILSKISKQFWPVRIILNPLVRKQLRKSVVISILLVHLFLTCGVISMSGYVLMSVRSYQLFYPSIFPFDWSKNFVYEFIYLCQSFINFYNILIVCTFDLFFVTTVSVCMVQFVILQAVLKFMFDEESLRHRRIIFGEKGENMTSREILSKCLEQHKMLLSICNDLETTLHRATLMLLAACINGNCSACFMMTIDYSQATKMLCFALGHLLQLFYYCRVCQELSNEGENLADAIYASNWSLEYDRDIRRTLILMMQRSQRKIQITAIGLVVLDFSSFVEILRLIFSLYTFMTKML